jgi:hypothetical protein
MSRFHNDSSMKSSKYHKHFEPRASINGVQQTSNFWRKSEQQGKKRRWSRKKKFTEFQPVRFYWQLSVFLIRPKLTYYYLGALSALLKRPTDPRLRKSKLTKNSKYLHVYLTYIPDSGVSTPEFPSFFNQKQPAEQSKVVETPNAMTLLTDHNCLDLCLEQYQNWRVKITASQRLRSNFQSFSDLIF